MPDALQGEAELAEHVPTLSITPRRPNEVQYVRGKRLRISPHELRALVRFANLRRAGPGRRGEEDVHPGFLREAEHGAARPQGCRVEREAEFLTDLSDHTRGRRLAKVDVAGGQRTSTAMLLVQRSARRGCQRSRARSWYLCRPVVVVDHGIDLGLFATQVRGQHSARGDSAVEMPARVRHDRRIERDANSYSPLQSPRPGFGAPGLKLPHALPCRGLYRPCSGLSLQSSIARTDARPPRAHAPLGGPGPARLPTPAAP